MGVLCCGLLAQGKDMCSTAELSPLQGQELPLLGEAPGVIAPSTGLSLISSGNNKQGQTPVPTVGAAGPLVWPQ